VVGVTGLYAFRGMVPNTRHSQVSDNVNVLRRFIDELAAALRIAVALAANAVGWTTAAQLLAMRSIRSKLRALRDLAAEAMT
jgi:hypothetical protein